MKTTVDSRQMHAKIEAATTRVADLARAEGVGVLAGFAAETLGDLTPKDTNRAANGWIDAGRKAGVTDQPLAPLAPSRHRDRFLTSLREQITRFEEQVRQAEEATHAASRKVNDTRRKRESKNNAKPVSLAPYTRAMGRLEKARFRLTRSREELAKAEASEFFLYFGANAAAEIKNQRALSTVRDRVYGGDFVRVIQGGMELIDLINREPHIAIIERHPHLGHPIATTRAILEAVGRRLGSDRYLAVMRAKSPLSPAARAA